MALSPNGSVVSSVKVTKNIELYAIWVKKDINKDWNPTFVQGNVTLLASDEVYENDGIKTYNDVMYGQEGFKEAWVECYCGKACQFKVKDHKGNVIITDHFLYVRSTGKYYFLSSSVKSTKTVSSDWAFIDITTSVDKVTSTKCTCGSWNRSAIFDMSATATYKD